MMRKKISVILASLLLLCCLGGCGGGAGPIGGDDIGKAPEGAVDTAAKTISTGSFKLKFQKGKDGYGVYLYSKDGDEVNFYCETPALLKTRGASAGLIGGFKENNYKQAYSSVVSEPYGFRATAKVKTEGGSEFTVEDKYHVLKSGVFALYRDVKVDKKGSEVGFATTVSFTSGADSDNYEDFEYFIPAVIYKDTQDMASGAIASSLDLDRVYVKETRTGLPMAMLRNKQTGHSLTLSHYKPEIDPGELGGGVSGAYNNALKFGAIGYTVTPKVSVDFVYPCSEGPNTYDSGQGWSKRYHEIKTGYIQSYKTAVIPDDSADYNTAFVNSYKTAYTLENPAIADVDPAKVYDQNLEIFDKEWREFGTGSVKAAGLPWSLSLPDASLDQGYSFQMGFVGQQVSVGAHLYREGIIRGDAGLKEKGEKIVDFWASPAIMSTYFPTVWWDPSNNAGGGSRREYPSFLRCFVDGMEGMLEAYKISASAGEPRESWKAAALKAGSNLVAKQNSDGSFYRAYKTDGSVETGGDNNTRGTSKLNTPIAVRYLAKLYELTGEEKYKTAAISASEFSYQNLYLNKGKYVGGTPDNPNTVDKEAAIYALYAFDAAFTLTGEEKYLAAAEHAAVCAMSWTYCYDFAVQAQNSEDEAKNPFSNGGTSGFSVIATGHSGADNFSAYMYYAAFRMYVHTGDAFYKDAALFLQNNTKNCTDHDGRLGYKYKAMMPEATNIADMSFASVGTWLPWSGIANVDPMMFTENTFGNKDVRKVSGELETLRNELEEYGVGGMRLK